MGFMESYKRLDRLCADALNEERGIPAYIDAMIADPRGAYYTNRWNEDLNQLKHYRWLRNKIAHEPGYTEQNLCTAEDVRWVEDFYMRMLEQTDPLALYRKARCTVSIRQDVVRKQVNKEEPSHPQNTNYYQMIGWIAAILGLLLILAGAILPMFL